MNRKSFFKKPLLISQEEMAMLLGVTRSQWTMYIIGQRGLSVQGIRRLEQVLTSVNSISSAQKEKLIQEKAQEYLRQKVIVDLLQDNKLKQLRLQKKLLQMEEKFQAALNTLCFVGSYKTKTINQSVLQVVETKANKLLDTNGLHLQEVHKMKLEVLKHEEMLLLKRKKKLV
ncbi:helix-turn-helix transcriptional regulator [Flavobacterium sp.]|jgi:predicted transcriptional regulator|uniref:helix-turn-helix domain-containing protein n=1 Tax=Flavobacterium sp. TaxID=239 RepID=UPI002A820634|nr:helix-turn-helix transcriptional regulator [Flavobacterium sp.]